jgi:hypothetical protein
MVKEISVLFWLYFMKFYVTILSLEAVSNVNITIMFDVRTSEMKEALTTINVREEHVLL